MKKEWAVSLGFILLCWAGASLFIMPGLLPSPWMTFKTLLDLSFSGELPWHVIVSLSRVLAGTILAIVVGVPLGVLMAMSLRLRQLVGPVMDLVFPIPPVAWIPLSLLWFGFSETAKVFIIFLGAFYPILTNTTDGVLGIAPQVLRAANNLGASRSQLFFKVLIPAALPRIYTGVLVGTGLAFRTLVAAELAGAFAGLGYLVMAAREVGRLDIILAGIVTLAAMGFGMTWILNRVRTVVFRWEVNPTPERFRWREIQ